MPENYRSIVGEVIAHTDGVGHEGSMFPITVRTTGYQGGDGGHGGQASITIKFPETCVQTIILTDGDKKFRSSNLNQLEIGVNGDWEIEGIIDSLREISLQILKHSVEENREQEWD
jgi:hypothetical protein